MKSAILNAFCFGLLAIIVTGVGSHVMADAQSDVTRIAYWRTHFPELKPEEDARVHHAHAIFERLIQVAGKRSDVNPKLYITKKDPWQLTLPIALPQGWIVLSKGVLDICYRNPEQGDDRLAFILGHELSHQLNSDTWHLLFFQAIDAKSRQPRIPKELLAELQRAALSTEQGLQRELRTDERGIIYATMAGFDPHVIVTADDSINFFCGMGKGIASGRHQ